MLVEINLLPQKERRKKAFVIALSSLLGLLIFISGAYIWQISSTKSDIKAIDNRLTLLEKATELSGDNNTQTPASSESVSLLKNAVDWADNYPLQTVPVMKHMTSLLPERGFIQTFGYTESGIITLTVQFDSAREAAYFLDSLNASEWLEEANMTTLNAEEKATEDKQTSSTTTTGKTEQNEYLPRYVGQFEVKFDAETIKKLMTATDDKEEGAKNS
jgi:hypothetical protein